MGQIEKDEIDTYHSTWQKKIHNLQGIDESQVVESARFIEDLGAASIQSIELVAAYEEEFDIDMDQDEALAVKTVDDAIRFIATVVAEQHG